MNTKFPLLILFQILFAISLSSQCINKVIHSSGTEIINDISVTASSFGFTDDFPLCAESEPYIIGWETDSMPYGDGWYKFEFSPPIDSLNLNFSYINANDGLSEETVIIYRNGEHYQIKEIKPMDSCSDSLATIDSVGNLVGPSTDNHFGGNISVEGPINEIIVKDSFLVGQPLGVSFSLTICSEFVSSTNQSEFDDLTIYPIPSSNILNVEGINNNTMHIELVNFYGEPVSINPTIANGKTIFSIEHLPEGLYYLYLSTHEARITRKIIKSRN